MVRNQCHLSTINMASMVEAVAHCKTPKHGGQLLAHLHSLYQSGELCDVILSVDGYLEFKAHRVVLSAFSTYFQSLFGSTSDLAPGGNRHDIPDIRSGVLGQILDYMYTGHVELADDNVWHLLAASTQLGIQTIVEQCQEFMRVSSESAETQYKDDVAAMALVDMVKQMTAFTDTSAHSVQTSYSAINSSGCEQIHHKPEPVRSPMNEKLQGEHSDWASLTEHTEVKLEQSEESGPYIQSGSQGEVPKAGDSDDDPTWNPEAGKQQRRKHKKREPTRARKTARRSSQQSNRAKNGGSKQAKNTKKSKTDSHLVSEQPADQKKGNPRKKTITKSNQCRRSKKNKRSTQQKPRQHLLPHVCSQCSEQFVHHSSLRLHEKVHNPLNKSIHPYTSPNKFMYLSGLPSYWQRHRINKCLHQKCTSVFKHYSTYKRHFMTVHCPPYLCIKCNKFMKSKLSLIRHKIEEHPILFRVHTGGLKRCICGRQFVHVRNLKMHKKVHKGKINCISLKCSQCGRFFKYREALEAHLTTHVALTEELRREPTSPSLGDGGGPEQGVKGKVGNPLLGLVQNPDKDLEYPYKCPVCDKVFPTIMHLKLHMSAVHKLPVTRATTRQKGRKSHHWKCTEDGCEDTYSTHMELRSHMLSAHPTVLFHCPHDNCKYKTPVHAMMVKHTTNNHNSDKRCEHCGKDFSKKYFLRVHMYAKHDVKDPRVRVHKCPQVGCSYETFQRNILEHHLQRHNTEKLFTCETCGKKLKTEMNLKKHMNKIHLKIRPYVCDQCGASYGELSELKIHIVRHSKEKQFKCEHCTYESHDKGNYQSHLWAKHKVAMGKTTRKALICNVCDYSCVHKARFDEHMNSHMGIRPHKCPECNQEFLSRSTMKGHMKWKHMGKTLNCDFCDYRCNTLHFLREHVRVQHTHRHIKPYKCVYCDYKCAISGNCRKHIANKHKGMPIKWEKVCDKWGPNHDKPVLGAERGTPPSAMYNMNTFNQSVDRLISGPGHCQIAQAIVDKKGAQNTAETKTENLSKDNVGIENTFNPFSNRLENPLVDTETNNLSVNQEDQILEPNAPGTGQLMYNVYQPEPVVVQGQHDYSQTISFYPIP